MKDKADAKELREPVKRGPVEGDMPSNTHLRSIRTAMPTPARSSRTSLASRYWHGVIALVVGASLITQIVLLLAGGNDVNATTGQPAVGPLTKLARLFSYFTIQSNLLVLITSIGLAIHPERDGRLWRVLRLDALLGIVITGIVFAAVLSKQVQHSGIGTWLNFGFHYFAPWCALLGWLLFGPRPRMDARTIAWAFAWPTCWIAFTFVRGAATGWYPYPFLNADALGFGIALRNTMGVVLMAAVIAALLYALEHRLVRAGR